MIKHILENKRHHIKTVATSLMFFLVAGAYTLVKELKDSLFVHIVGLDHIPQAKIMSFFALIPALLVYAKLVDKLSKVSLLRLFTTVYGIIGCIIASYLAHPRIGLLNTAFDKYRYFGWLLYLFIESYPVFIVGLYWAFLNSITSSQEAREKYPTILAVSKLGGVCVAMVACWLLSHIGRVQQNDVMVHQLLMLIASGLLLLVPLVLYCCKRLNYVELMEEQPAVQQEEFKESAIEEKISPWNRIFVGLLAFWKYPYVLGIFGMSFFWEMVNAIFGYERLGLGKATTITMTEYSCFLFKSIALVHIMGIVIALLGTRTLLDKLGERRAIIMIPLIIGILIAVCLVFRGSSAMFVMGIWVLLRSINTGLIHPIREMLYIPTSKTIRFKTRSWIEAFGTKFAKVCGAGYNIYAPRLFLNSIIPVVFLGSIIGLWILTARFVGKKLESAIKYRKVIGLDEV